MTALVTVGEDEITIELSGSAALPQQRRMVRIPLDAISTVKTKPPTNNSLASALANIAGPLTAARTGSVVHEGRHLLLAYTPGEPTLTLELDRKRFPAIEYDTIVLRTSAAPGSTEFADPTAA